MQDNIPNSIWDALTPEQRARFYIDKRLEESGWVVQSMNRFNPRASIGVAVREFATSTGPMDYGLFINGNLVGVVEAKKDEEGHDITSVEPQSSRYANSAFRYGSTVAHIRFAYEATGVHTIY